MTGWLIFAAVGSVIGAILTLVWWRIGDQWADEEHKRFQSDDRTRQEGAQVIRGFGPSQEEPDQPGRS